MGEKNRRVVEAHPRHPRVLVMRPPFLQARRDLVQLRVQHPLYLCSTSLVTATLNPFSIFP